MLRLLNNNFNRNFKSNLSALLACPARASANRAAIHVSRARQKQENVKLHALKNLTPAEVTETRQQSVGDKDFRMVFKFPYIVHVRAFCRLKIYQTAFTLIMAPGMGLAYLCGAATIEQCTYAVAIASLACTVLYIVSGLFRRFIGIVYLNPAQDTVKVAHLNFWGNRKDVILPLKDIMAFSEIEGNDSTNIYNKLKLYSTNEVYFYYVSRFGGVLAREEFKLIFGENVPIPGSSK